jgi:hypothetical protein
MHAFDLGHYITTLTLIEPQIWQPCVYAWHSAAFAVNINGEVIA